jgi:hypothetical protein
MARRGSNAQSAIPRKLWDVLTLWRAAAAILPDPSVTNCPEGKIFGTFSPFAQY